MGLFGSSPSALLPEFAAAAVGSDAGGLKRIQRAQDAIRAEIQSDDQLRAVSACVMSSYVMAITNTKVIIASSRNVEYVIAGADVSRTSIGRTDMVSGPHSARFSACVWAGHPIKHKTVRGLYLGDDMASVSRWDYDEANLLVRAADVAFGLVS